MKPTYAVPHVAYALILGIAVVGLFNTCLQLVEARCLSYFLHTFQSFDLAPEACAHIVKGEQMRPYVFGQEPVSPSSL